MQLETNFSQTIFVSIFGVGTSGAKCIPVIPTYFNSKNSSRSSINIGVQDSVMTQIKTIWKHNTTKITDSLNYGNSVKCPTRICNSKIIWRLLVIFLISETMVINCACIQLQHPKKLDSNQHRIAMHSGIFYDKECSNVSLQHRSTPNRTHSVTSQKAAIHSVEPCFVIEKVSHKIQECTNLRTILQY